MAAPQRNTENLTEMQDNAVEPLDSIQTSLEKYLSLSSDDTTEIGMLRARISEQSSLICILKQRADDLLVRYQALQKINSELEDRVTDCQEELDGQRKKAELLEERFMDLAANNQAIITLMDEHKNLNAELKVENKQLQEENDTLFCQKLHDKEAAIQNLTQKIHELKDKYSSKENEYRELLTRYHKKPLEQATQHQAMEAPLCNQLHEAQQMCTELKLKLQKAEEEYALKEHSLRESIINLTKDNDKLLSLSMDRGREIQEKQEELQQIEDKLKKEQYARAKAEDRFKEESELVNADAKVKSLQAALDDSITQYKELMKDFEAFKEHSTSLLDQERELNTKLRHMLV